MINLGEQQIYLESFRDITGIYTERKEQYRIYQRLLISLIAINGIISYLISLWITYPIKKVSIVAHKISNGSLDNRVSIRSKDEIGRLAEDFNRMTDSLEDKIHQLQEAARRQEDFIGSFAHELKTPLTSIIGYADILRSNKMTPEMIIMSANYIFKEGIRLEALSLKLLELIVMQKQELDLKKVRAKQLFDDVKGLVTPVLEKEGILITIEVQDSWLYLEPDLMKTVLINLIDNGKKAIEGTGWITLKGVIEKDGYSIYVKDSGKGIPQEELSKITEAFYMVDKSRAREMGGAGLGLAICLEIIKRHHGSIHFDSTVGIGTTVHVFLKDGEV
jgi:signal transduction histidine kinase